MTTDDFTRFGDFKALERTFPDLEDVTMVDVTDAAVGAMAGQMRGAAFREVGYWGLPDKAWIVAARHVLTSRQPKPGDVDHLVRTMKEAKRGYFGQSGEEIFARAILALYDAPARIPTRSALDSALDPILGDSKARRAVVDVVLGVVGACPGNTALADENATLLREQALHRQDYDKLFAQLVTTQAELAAAKSAQSGTIRLGEGLTEAQEGWPAQIKLCEAEIFDEMRKAMERFVWEDTAQGFDYWRDVSINAERIADALRASAAPKAEAVTVHGFTITADPARRLVGIDVSNCGAFSPEATLAIADALRSAAGGSV